MGYSPFANPGMVGSSCVIDGCVCWLALAASMEIGSTPDLVVSIAVTVPPFGDLLPDQDLLP